MHEQRSFNGFLSYIDNVYRRGLARTRVLFDRAMLSKQYEIYHGYEGMPPRARPRRERVARDRAQEEAAARAAAAEEQAKRDAEAEKKENCIIS